MTDKLPLAERLAVNPREAAQLLGCSHDTVYALIHSGQLHSLTVGKRRLIPVEAIRRFLAPGAEAAS